MAQIIRDRRKVLVESYSHDFHLTGQSKGNGFGFTCDKEGKIDREAWNPVAEENYQKCVDKVYDVVDDGIVKYSHYYWEYAVCLCHCGQEVELYDAMTNACDCGQLYNGSGQELAPREQWEENWDEDY